MLRLVLLPRREVPRLQAEHEDSEEKGVYRVMEMLCFGFLIGAVSCMVFMGVGIAIGQGGKDNDTRDTSNTDRHSEVLLHGRSDNVPDVPLRNGYRHSVERSDEPMVEKAMNVLEVFKVGACRYETEVIEWLEDMLEQKEYPLGRNDWQE